MTFMAHIYNLASFNATNAGKFWLNMTFLVSFVEAIKGRNQQAAKGNQFVSTLYMNPRNHRRVV